MFLFQDFKGLPIPRLDGGVPLTGVSFTLPEAARHFKMSRAKLKGLYFEFFEGLIGPHPGQLPPGITRIELESKMLDMGVKSPFARASIIKTFALKHEKLANLDIKMFYRFVLDAIRKSPEVYGAA